MGEALRSALDLFWTRGYRGASLEDLCRATKMSKSTLYAVFGDKRRLFLACVQAYTDDLLNEFHTRFRASSSPYQFIRRVFLDLAAEAGERADRRGCLVMNTATEFAQTDPEVAKIVGAALDGMAAVFEEALIDANRRKEIRIGDPRTTARYLVSSVAGMKTMVKAGRPEAELSTLAEVVLQQLARK